MIDDFIVIAKELADRDPGRPKEASLRRAAATAYYAVFHALCWLAADTLVGINRPWEVYEPVYRSVDHASARKVFVRARTDASFPPVVAAVGLTFIALQDARIEADYVPWRFRLSRREVKDLIAEASGAIQSIRDFAPEVRLQLAVRLITRAR